MAYPMSTQQVAHAPLTLFCSYADADQRFKQELEKHLKILLDQRVVTFWSHDQIPSGLDRAQVIQEQLQAASAILLLLSPDFFNSHQCLLEIEHALERQQSGTVRIFLILVRPCLWDVRLQDLPVLPELTEPVTLWRNRDQAWLSIVLTLCQYLRISTTAFAASRPIIFQARALPLAYVPRPTEFNAIKRLLMSKTSTGTPAAITTALRGAGGFGKTTLAQALCHDPDIQATFADGILWITLGETPPKPLSLLKDLIASFPSPTKQRANVNTLEQAAAHWRDLLEPRSCLVVLDDVWQNRSHPLSGRWAALCTFDYHQRYKCAPNFERTGVGRCDARGGGHPIALLWAAREHPPASLCRRSQRARERLGRMAFVTYPGQWCSQRTDREPQPEARRRPYGSAQRLSSRGRSRL